MESSNSQLRTKTLRFTPRSADFLLYKAALQWSLIDPIVIENREDMKSEQKWRDLVNPYHHQVTNLITFCRRLPVTLLADDVGLGKTISAGLVASELISRGRVSKILVVCPKLLMPQWEEELKVKFDIPSVIAIGSKLIKVKTPDEACAVITTYQSARLHLDDIAKTGFEMLILDEAHKLRNLYGVDPPPQVAIRFRKALADRLFKYVLMLTATPIHNRLWDIYSLIDLLTVARGHENPFGGEGIFARKYIADNRKQARILKQEMRDDFRNIVYSYMSRIRRADVELYFPERHVKLHRVVPTAEEAELIQTISSPIQKMNRLAQISILQALTSSPHALSAQLNNMAQKGTVPKQLALNVKRIVEQAWVPAKLRGLDQLLSELRAQKPEDWRVVIFTGRIETQTSILKHLEEQKIKCGVINGDSGKRNQDTITKFKKLETNVIISTEAGAEGINLQIANVLVNYDLPWNPMIVEQRIGRIQRLASEHATVAVFNIISGGTFEEYIVGRLMEKLQLASHAIGDVEALLEAANLNDNENQESESIEEKIRKLVIESLAGKDVEAATRATERSIEAAKEELKKEEENINSVLGRMDGSFDDGPRCPKLPQTEKIIDASTFVLSALQNMGAKLKSVSADVYRCEYEGRRDIIALNSKVDVDRIRPTVYVPGSAAFERLVQRMIETGLHRVEDVDDNIENKLSVIARRWVNDFGGRLVTTSYNVILRNFEGHVLVRVRATVAHDSYERLLEIECEPGEHSADMTRQGLNPINSIIEDPKQVGMNSEKILSRAIDEQNITEFCRFYEERGAREVEAAGHDERKRKKLEDDFSPRLELTLVGLEGLLRRTVGVQVTYKFDTDDEYNSTLTIIPSLNRITQEPEMETCVRSGQKAPADCFAKCDISGVRLLKHLLVKSEISERHALPEHTVICSFSGKRVLKDEVETSSVTGKLVARTMLKTSSYSGKRAESQFIVKCEFSNSDLLESEALISQISGKRYRPDEQLTSVVSGKSGHRQEFIICPETHHPLLSSEAEKCELTGKVVVPGLLQSCEISGMKVIPSELEKCAVTNQRALKRYFVTSSISGARLLEKVAIKSSKGEFCAPAEAKKCAWSGMDYHPSDMQNCALTGLPIYFKYMTTDDSPKLESLYGLLNGTRHSADQIESWPIVASAASRIINGHCKVSAAEISADGQHLAVDLEVRTLLGLKLRHAGLIFANGSNRIHGRIPIGKRSDSGWNQEIKN